MDQEESKHSRFYILYCKTYFEEDECRIEIFSKFRLMVDCLQSESLPVDSIFSQDGSVKTGSGCLTATIQRCLLSDHVEYDIQVKHPRGHSWCVSRRYREFRALSASLRVNYAMPDDVLISLPTRKLFNNLSPVFVCQRSRELEDFLNRLLLFYTLPPPPLAEFLEWERYDVHGITNALARQLFKEGDSYLADNFLYPLQVYQLSSINSRIISPVSTNLFNKQNEDFGHVLGFISKLQRLKLTGSIEKLYKSNIALNALNFDMSPFKSLQYLELNNVDLRRMRGFEHIKTTVTQLVVHHSLKNLKNLMLGDLFAAGDGDWVYGDNPVATLPWDQIKIADFSNNFLHTIDQTIALLPMVEILYLSNNLLTEIADLTALKFLRVLYVADNQLYLGEEAGLFDAACVTANGSLELAVNSTFDNCSADSGQRTLPEEAFAIGCTSFSVGTNGSSIGGHGSALDLGKSRKPPTLPLCARLLDVQVLVFAYNGLRSANIVAGMISLQHLDLSNNKIDSFNELVCLGELPHLNSVELTGNPLCDYPYYRRNVLDLLGLRFSVIALDGQRANLAELESVQLYRALKQGGATPSLFLPDPMKLMIRHHIEAGSQLISPVPQQTSTERKIQDLLINDLNPGLQGTNLIQNPIGPINLCVDSSSHDSNGSVVAQQLAVNPTTLVKQTSPVLATTCFDSFHNLNQNSPKPHDNPFTPEKDSTHALVQTSDALCNDLNPIASEKEAALVNDHLKSIPVSSLTISKSESSNSVIKPFNTNTLSEFPASHPGTIIKNESSKGQQIEFSDAPSQLVESDSSTKQTSNMNDSYNSFVSVEQFSDQNNDNNFDSCSNTSLRSFRVDVAKDESRASRKISKATADSSHTADNEMS